MRYQQSLVEDALSARALSDGAQIEPELRSDEVVRFNKEQLDKFTSSVTTGFVRAKLLSFYSALLQEYRRSHALVILNLLSYTWLFVQSIILLTLVNYSVFVAAPRQYKIDGYASVARFVFYSTTSLYGNTISQITANGNIAFLIATIAAIYGPLFLVSLGMQIVLSLRQSKDDAAFGDLIRLVKSREVELSRQLEAEYEVTLDEAIRRLHDLGLTKGTFLAYLASKIPSDINDAGESDESASGEHPFGR